MLVLDTNVLSELMNPGGAPIVATWANKIRRADIFTTAVNKAEILYGLAIMPKGRKRTDRIRWAGAMFDENFHGRILPFDERAAEHYADIAAMRERLGRRIELVDAQIASIARSNGMAIVTRNVRDFADCGIDIVNPWSA